MIRNNYLAVFSFPLEELRLLFDLVFWCDVAFEDGDIDSNRDNTFEEGDIDLSRDDAFDDDLSPNFEISLTIFWEIEFVGYINLVLWGGVTKE